MVDVVTFSVVVVGLFFSGFRGFFLLRNLVFGHIQTFIDGRWDGLDLSAKFLFDLIQVESIVISDQVDRNS